MAANKQKNTIIKDSIALFLITLIAGLALGFVNEVTKGPIQAAKDKEKAEAYGSVYEGISTFNDLDGKFSEVAKTSKDTLSGAGISGVTITEVLEAKENDQVVGYVMAITSAEGYGGNIDLSMGITAEGEITGIQILSHSETAGLGAKAEEPEFRNQYKGMNADSLEVVKDTTSADNQIQAISGATITSNAVTNAVNGGIYFAKNCTGN